MRNSVDVSDDEKIEERRREARHKLVLRAAVLEQNGKSSFCLVRNVSSQGVQLKVYAQPVVGAEISLRVADEPTVMGHVAWVNGDNAGIQLNEEFDDATLLRVRSKLKPQKRRAFPRMEVTATALLRSGGKVTRVDVRDISSLGARVASDTQLEPGSRVIIDLADLPTIGGYVRWVGGQEAGLAFETPVPMQIIARWLHARVRAAA